MGRLSINNLKKRFHIYSLSGKISYDEDVYMFSNFNNRKINLIFCMEYTFGYYFIF